MSTSTNVEAEGLPELAPRPQLRTRHGASDGLAAPATLQDVMPRTPPSSDGGAGNRAGMVIEPPSHPDARPWPEGIAMAPPDIKDPMAMGVRAPASAPLRAAALWGKRLADSLQERLGKIVELALPRSL